MKIHNVEDLFNEYQSKVKPEYKAISFDAFITYLIDDYQTNEGFIGEGYIELSSHETLSGHTEILYFQFDD